MTSTRIDPLETEMLLSASDKERSGDSSVEEDMTFTSPQSGSTPADLQVGLTPAVQKHIGNLLKASFQDLLVEPVPDRFSALLEQLEQAETKKGK